jgi:Spy/CpxP family protein refolding chaperone
MSTAEPTAPAPPPAASPPPPPRRSRLRRFLFVTALLLTGGVIGAGVHSAAHGFGHGWRHGGPPGWYYYGGGDPTEWRGGPGDAGARFFLPGRIERGVERALWSVDASSEQRQKITSVLQRAADDLYALRAQHLEGRRQIREALAAATIDRGRIETLRTEQLKLADTATKRLSEAIADAAETLNPAQRGELARRLERWQRWHRG